LEYGALFDTISVCLSKGLGCPVGSVLIGSADTIQEAIRIRKILGGGMRQSGYLAAAGIYALDHHIERLEEDHKKAKELAQALQSRPFVRHIEPVETNILIFELEESLMTAAQFETALAAKDIHIIGMGGGKLRMVTHMDYSDEMHAKVLEVLQQLS